MDAVKLEITPFVKFEVIPYSIVKGNLVYNHSSTLALDAGSTFLFLTSPTGKHTLVGKLSQDHVNGLKTHSIAQDVHLPIQRLKSTDLLWAYVYGISIISEPEVKHMDHIATGEYMLSSGDGSAIPTSP